MIFLKKKTIQEDSFNFYFDLITEANGGTPIIKKLSLAKFIEIKESFDLCDI